jgi:hypothetical protein
MMRSINHHASKGTLKYSSMLASVMIHNDAKLGLDGSFSLTGLGMHRGRLQTGNLGLGHSQ